MTHSLHSSVIALSALTASLLLATSPLAQAANGVDSQKAETVGVFSGLAIGALVGGPPGAIISAAAGAWVGEQVMIRKNHRQLQARLAETETQLTSLESTNATLQAQQLALQKRLYERELLASTTPPPARTAEARPSCTTAGVISPMPTWRCSPLYQRKNAWQKTRASSRLPKRAGKSGRYFSVLNWASENGLSLETWGREWLRVTPRSASNSATGLLVIDVPRSAWRNNWPGPIPCVAQVSAINRWASAADSRGATIHPVTYRLKMSRIT